MFAGIGLVVIKLLGAVAIAYVAVSVAANREITVEPSVQYGFVAAYAWVTQ